MDISIPNSFQSHTKKTHYAVCEKLTAPILSRYGWVDLTTYCNTLKLPNLMYCNTLSNQLGHTERVRVPCVFRKQSAVLSSYSFIPISHKKSFTIIVTETHTKFIKYFFRRSYLFKKKMICEDKKKYYCIHFF